MNSKFFRALAARLPLLLIASLLSLVAPVQVATAANAVNQCKPITDADAANGYDSGDITITPLHGMGFYTDFKNGINASYIGYAIKNDTGAEIKDLWLEISNFRAASGTTVMSLANPNDAYQPIGAIAGGATKHIFILLRASMVTEVKQIHDARVHKGYPSGDGTLYKTGANPAACYYEFTKVLRTLAASANKVTSISVDTNSPKLGGTLVVTVQGSTGQAGSGSASPDGDVMWLSGASNSLWPTRALRLESTALTIKLKKNDPSNKFLNFTNVMIVQDVTAANTKFTSSTTYTATFTFRVTGGAATNPVVQPVAQISSGTQIKHTGSYPATNTSVALNNLSSTITSIKEIPANGVDSATDANFFIVDYKITLTDSDTSVTRVVDSIVDVPDPATVYVTGSAKIVDSRSATATTIPDPIDDDADVNNERYVFGGPFTFRSGTIILTYKMKVPKTNSTTFANTAYGLIGGTPIAKSANNFSGASVVVNGSGGVTTNSNLNAARIKQDQVIDFPAIPVLGAGTSYTLQATASSGLTITYTSSTLDVCTVSESTLIIKKAGDCTITASQAGNDDWNAATQVPRTTTMLPGQVITFAPNNSMAVGATQSVAATSDSTLPVSVVSLTTDVCTVSGASTPYTITAVTSGLCVLIASQSGGTTGGVTFGAAADVERTVKIGATQTLSFVTTPPNTANTNSSATISAITKNASNTTITTLAILFTSRTPDVCTAGETTLSQAGTSSATVTWTIAGTCVIVASQDGFLPDGTISAYAPATDITHSFVIGNNTPSVTITAPASVNSAATTAITVTVTAPNGYPGSGTKTLSGTVSLFANGTRALSSASQSTSITVTIDVATTRSSTSTFNVVAGTLAPGAANESYVLTAAFTRSSTDFSSASTTSDTTVEVVAPPPPVAPTVTTGNLSAHDTTTATLPGTFNAKENSQATAIMLLGTSSNNLTEPAAGNRTYTGNTSTGDQAANFSVAVTGLTSATLYYYEAKVTRSDLTAFGTIKSFITKPDAPTAGAVTAGSNSASMAFTGVTNSAGVSILYTISCVAGQSTITATGTNSPITVNGLTANTQYTCSIKATASATDVNAGHQGGGDGAAANYANFTTAQAKTARTVAIYKATTQDQTASIVYGQTITMDVTPSAGENDGTKSINIQSGANKCSRNGLVVSTLGIGNNACTIRGIISEGTTHAYADTTGADFTLTITAAQLTITASSHTLTYNDPSPVVTYAVDGLVNGDQANVISGITCTTNYVQGTSVTGDAVTTSCSGGTATNYTFIYVAGAVTIQKKNQTITFDPLNNMVVTDPDQTPTFSTDALGLTPVLTIAAQSAAICSIVAGKIKADSAGSCVVNANEPGNNKYNPANQVQRSFTVTENQINNNQNNNNQNNNQGGGAPTPPPGPRIDSLSKTEVCSIGHEIIILGANFENSTVTLDGAATVVKSLTGSSITVVLPRALFGKRVIRVANTNGSDTEEITYVTVPKPRFQVIALPYMAQGDYISLPVMARYATSYRLSGSLPPGLSLDPVTGLISGTATGNGIFNFSVIATGICGETTQIIELDIDKPIPNAISHRIYFVPNSNEVPESAKESLEKFIEKAKELSPRNIVPQIYITGGANETEKEKETFKERRDSICEFFFDEKLLGDVLFDVFIGSPNRIEIIIYWPRPEY